MVTRTRLNVTLYVHCLSCSRFVCPLYSSFGTHSPREASALYCLSSLLIPPFRTCRLPSGLANLLFLYLLTWNNLLRVLWTGDSSWRGPCCGLGTWRGNWFCILIDTRRRQVIGDWFILVTKGKDPFSRNGTCTVINSLLYNLMFFWPCIIA